MDVHKATGPAGILFGVAALVTAIGSLREAGDDSVTRATYDVMAANVRALRRDAQRNRDDLAWLRDVVISGQRVTVLPVDGGVAEVLGPDGGAVDAPQPTAIVVVEPAQPSEPEPVEAPRPRVAGGAQGTRSVQLDEPLPPFDAVKQAAAE